MLKRSIAAVGAFVTSCLSQDRANGNAESLSPGNRKVINYLRNLPSGGRATPHSIGRDGAGLPFGYCVRPKVVEAHRHPGKNSAASLPTIRFSIVGADPALLTFLGKEMPGFHVVELSCGGLEIWWRNDLVTVLETRAAIVGRMTIFSDAGDIRLEHLALPVLETGRVVAIRGWFDQIDPTPNGITSRYWAGLRSVRRFERPRSIAIPAGSMRAIARWPVEEARNMCT